MHQLRGFRTPASGRFGFKRRELFENGLVGFPRARTKVDVRTWVLRVKRRARFGANS